MTIWETGSLCMEPSATGRLFCILPYPHLGRGHVWAHESSRIPDPLGDEGEVTNAR